MTIHLPPSDIDQRLGAFDDPDFTAHLMREHPELFAAAPPQTPRGVLAWSTRRFALPALAVVTAISVAAGYVLAPLATHRHPAPAPHAVAPPAIRARAAAPVAPRRPSHIVPAAALVAPAAAPVRHPQPAPVVHAAPVAHVAAVAHAAPITHLAPAAHLAPVAHPAPHAAAATAAAPKAQPQEAIAGAAATATATTSLTASAPAAAAPVAPRSDADVAAASARGWYDAPQPGGEAAGVKGPPTGNYSLQNSGEHPVFGGTADPCSPRGGRIGSVLGSLAR